MCKYKRNIIKSLMQLQFSSYEKFGSLDVKITDGAIFSHIANYDKHKFKYEKALVECVQLGYIIEHRERTITYYRITDKGARLHTNWIERLIGVGIGIATSIVAGAIVELIKFWISRR